MDGGTSTLTVPSALLYLLRIHLTLSHEKKECIDKVLFQVSLRFSSCYTQSSSKTNKPQIKRSNPHPKVNTYKSCPKIETTKFRPCPWFWYQMPEQVFILVCGFYNCEKLSWWQSFYDSMNGHSDPQINSWILRLRQLFFCMTLYF